MKRNLVISSFLTLGLIACGGEETPNENNNTQGDTTSDVVVKSCDSGTFGPDCQPVTCVHGTANDGKDGDGKCASCNKGWSGDNCDQCQAVGQNQMTDDDCNIYNTVVINNKTWMAENLRNSSVDHYSADNKSSNDATYGYLYTYENAIKACPEGWRLPTNEEYLALIGGTEYSIDIDTTDIQDPSWVSSATNSTGFSALPAGNMNDNNFFSGLGSYAKFWSSTPSGASDAFSLYVGNSYAYVSAGYAIYAYSVRCIKDEG